MLGGYSVKSGPVSKEFPQPSGMKYLVEGVKRWLKYAASDVMQFVQKVVADTLQPAVRESAAGLLAGLAMYGNRNSRRCMARNVLPLLQISSTRRLGLGILCDCKYDLGRHGGDIVNALCDIVSKESKHKDHYQAFIYLEQILKHSPSPGKIYPQAWVFLNSFLRRSSAFLKPRVRHLWLLLGSTWSRRAPAEDCFEYYPRSPFWWLTSHAERKRMVEEHRQNCMGRCPKGRFALSKDF